MVYRDKRYRLFLSFDNVLRLFDMFRDDDIDDLSKPYMALIMLTKSQDWLELPIEEVIELYQLVFDQHIKIKRPIDQKPRYDIEGNILPERPIRDDEDDEDDDKRPPFDFRYDAPYIYASFMQAYKIDLIEEQGRLSWSKFNALFSGLPSDTKMAHVMEIRSWKPSDTKDKKEKEAKRKLQRLYELPRD